MAEEEQRIKGIVSELDRVREEWRAVRKERLRLKAELERRGMEKSEIRKHGEFKRLEKRQSHLSKVIKHIEKRLNRHSAKQSAHKA